MAKTQAQRCDDRVRLHGPGALATPGARSARFFRDLPVEPVLKVVVGRTEAKVKEAADAPGLREAAPPAGRRCWRRKDIDIVDICTPGDSHAPIAIAAAEAGKAILCEKPLANTVAGRGTDGGGRQEGAAS